MIDDDLYYILLDEVQLVPRFEALPKISENTQIFLVEILKNTQIFYNIVVILYQLGTKNQFVKNRTNTICVFYRDLSISLPFFEILSLLYIRKCCFNVFNCRQLALYVSRHELRHPSCNWATSCCPISSPNLATGCCQIVIR